MNDLYDEIRTYLLTLPSIQAWTELRDLVVQATAHRPRDWKLPVIASEAVGGTRAQVLPLSVAVACLQQSILLIDDMLDRDPRGYYQTRGLPFTANLASALQAVGVEAVANTQGASASKLATIQRLNRMVALIAFGQYQDSCQVDDEAAYWQIVAHKSSPFYGVLMAGGAAMGGATLEVIEQLQSFGELYGAMIQIHDDLNDSMAMPANPDWTEGRAPLPILYAQTVHHPERERFRALRDCIHTESALLEAQQILIRSGAISYCVHHLLHYYKQGTMLLSEIPLVDSAPLAWLLEELIVPVRQMFKNLNIPLLRKRGVL